MCCGQKRSELRTEKLWLASRKESGMPRTIVLKLKTSEFNGFAGLSTSCRICGGLRNSKTTRDMEIGKAFGLLPQEVNILPLS